MIQITAQMRVLVAIESVDGRKYAPYMNMRSEALPDRKNAPLDGLCTAHNGALTAELEAGLAIYLAAGIDRAVRSAEIETPSPQVFP
jgi:hypothetical protein